MTSSPDLIRELRSARPAAPAALRARVRDIAAGEPTRAVVPRLRFPSRRSVLVVLPAAAAIALASAGVLGLARSDTSTEALRQKETLESDTAATDHGGTPGALATVPNAPTASTALGPRAQRVSATLTVEVSDSDEVSAAAQDALDLTRTLGGFVVSSSVSTGTAGSASLTVRVPVARVQDVIVGFSGLGRIVSQQVNVEDLQETLDALEKREATVRTQIARIRARLATESLDPQTEAVLRARLQTLRNELVGLRTGIATTNAEARMATIQLSIGTPGTFGGVAPPSRIDRTIDEALNVLAWEGIIALGLLIVVAPFAVVGLAVWLGRGLYRRHEEDRLLAAS